MSRTPTVDKTFLFSVLALMVIGFTMFVSSAMGILAKDNAQFTSVVFKQGFFGIVLGLIACFVFSRVSYKLLKKYALGIFIFSLVLMALVFVPHVGASLNGARRWLIVAGLSFQPVAFLNASFVIYWAAWLSFVKDKVTSLKYGLLPLAILLAIMGGFLLLQPDTDSFIILCATGVTMLLLAGGRVRDMFFLFVIGLVGLIFLAFLRPYVMSRIETYFNPSANALTSGYQLQQAELAIGSGQMFGRGLGQSIQKYKFLPESISDSIFAVLGEEGGFVGCVFVIGLLLFFLFRGFRIAIRAPDLFGGLLVSGIVILITAQSFINISSVLGIIPFSGIPLVFFSQGGTSMLMVLAEMGIILNISRFRKTIVS